MGKILVLFHAQLELYVTSYVTWGCLGRKALEVFLRLELIKIVMLVIETKQ